MRGGGGRPAPRPSGYRLSPVRRWGCAGRRVLAVLEGVRGPLRQAQGEREGEWGMRWGDGDAPRRAPLDTGFRRYDGGGGCAGRQVLAVLGRGGGGPSSALRTGFDRLRAKGIAKRACDGEWGMRLGRRRPAPCPSGYRLSPVRLWGCASRQVLAVMEGVRGPLRVPSGQASTCSGRTDLGSGPATGSGGCDG